ncbi:MAG: ATP-binding protein [Chloroflexi bacterium]|nr:ATP-binding protein [Chloroflexota bacterium]
MLEHLSPLPPPSDRAVLVVLSGLPGVGKSTFARRLAALAPVAIVETDDVRKTLVPRPRYTNGEHALVFRVAYQALGALLRQGVSAVFDATNLTEDIRRRAYRVARDADAGLVVVAVHAPPEVVRQRMEARARGAQGAVLSQPALSLVEGSKGADRSDATWEVYQAMAPGAEPVRRPHYLMDTTQDTTEVLLAVAAAVRGEEPDYPLRGGGVREGVTPPV